MSYRVCIEIDVEQRDGEYIATSAALTEADDDGEYEAEFSGTSASAAQAALLVELARTLDAGSYVEYDA